MGMSGHNYQGTSSILLDRMNDIRSTYNEEHKKRLGLTEEKKTRTQLSSFKSGQAFYSNPNGKK